MSDCDEIKNHVINFIQQNKKNRLRFKILAASRCPWFEPVEHCQKLGKKCLIDECPFGASERSKG